jgi:uncharacterized coiled-coil DUF342 family protein
MSASPYSPEAMRAEFNRLGKIRDEILAKTAPLRAKRDAIYAEADAKAKQLSDAYLKIEEPLYEIDRTRHMLARALAGKGLVAKTGE